MYVFESTAEVVEITMPVPAKGLKDSQIWQIKALRELTFFKESKLLTKT